jgi:hypothetical protein
MILQDTSWLLSIVVAVMLFTGGSYLFIDNDTSEMIQISDLSDTDIDMILAVKAEMYAAQNSI